MFDKHGGRESLIVAHENPAHASMGIQAEHTYVEFPDAGGAPQHSAFDYVIAFVRLPAARHRRRIHGD